MLKFVIKINWLTFHQEPVLEGQPVTFLNVLEPNSVNTSSQTFPGATSTRPKSGSLSPPAK